MIAIKSIHLQLNLSTIAHPFRPWIDIFFRNVLPRFPNALDEPSSRDAVNLEISGPLPPGRSLRSIYSTSPNRFPWHCLPITKLKLHRLRFKSFGNLVQVLRELPMLRLVEGSQIIWNKPERGRSSFPSVVAFAHCNNRPFEVSYHIEESCPEMAIWLAIALAPSPSSCLRQNDANTLLSLASHIFIDGYFKAWSTRQAMWRARSDDRTISIALYLQFGVPGEEVSRGREHIWMTVRLASSESRKVREVRSITLDLDDYTKTRIMDDAFWAIVDDLVLRLDIEFMLLNLGSLKDIPTLTRLREAHKLKYGRRKRNTIMEVRICEDGTAKEIGELPEKFRV
ncbi:hypothetical protein EIP86_010453 [Pleurotus ostreatoroseus]|nr:hypothetical protein EIP86_010453 [Pleurotus ostreatoroseus]